MKKLKSIPFFADQKIKQVQEESMNIISASEEVAHNHHMSEYSSSRDADSYASLATDVHIQIINAAVKHAKDTVENIVENYYEFECGKMATLEQISIVCNSVIAEMELIASPYVVPESEQIFDFYK